MYVTITTQSVYLQTPINNSNGCLEVALREIFYKVKWLNISAAKQNNRIQKEPLNPRDFAIITIPDGYYEICSLQDQLSKQTGINIKINPANLMTNLSFDEPGTYTFEQGLAKMLGFRQHVFQVTDQHEFEGDHPVDLTVNALLYIHLNELNTNENLFDGQPSSILRALPTDRAAYCDHKINSFTDLQFRKLALGYHESLNLKITDPDGKEVECNELHVVLEIK